MYRIDIETIGVRHSNICRPNKISLAKYMMKPLYTKNLKRAAR